MKRIFVIITLSLFATLTFAQGTPNGKKALLAYFTYSENIDTAGMSLDAITSASYKTTNRQGNIQTMVQSVQAKRNVDTVSIRAADRYDSVYSKMVVRARKERADNARPAIDAQSRVANLAQYDVIYLGMPVWNGGIPKPVMTWLDQHDLSGKTVVVFNLHLGSREGEILRELRQKYPTATIADNFTISASASNADTKRQFDAFLDKLKI